MTLQDYLDYFTEIATNHKLIGHTEQMRHVFRVDVHELSTSLRSGVHWPLLGIETPILSSMGNSYANPRWVYNGAILILEKASDKYYTTQVTLTDDKTLGIAKDIVAKMIKDRKDWDSTQKAFVLQGLELGSFDLETVPLGFGDFKGWRLSFQFNEPMPRFDISKWNNETNASL